MARKSSSFKKARKGGSSRFVKRGPSPMEKKELDIRDRVCNPQRVARGREDLTDAVIVSKNSSFRPRGVDVPQQTALVLLTDLVVSILSEEPDYELLEKLLDIIGPLRYYVKDAQGSNRPARGDSVQERRNSRQAGLVPHTQDADGGRVGGSDEVPPGTSADWVEEAETSQGVFHEVVRY